MNKLPIKDKIFWKTFFQFIGLFIIIWLILGYGLNNPVDEEPEKGGFLGAYMILSFFVIIWVAYKVAWDFSEPGKNEKYITRNGKDFIIKKNDHSKTETTKKDFK